MQTLSGPPMFPHECVTIQSAVTLLYSCLLVINISSEKQEHASAKQGPLKSKALCGLIHSFITTIFFYHLHITPVPLF